MLNAHARKPVPVSVIGTYDSLEAASRQVDLFMLKQDPDACANIVPSENGKGFNRSGGQMAIKNRFLAKAAFGETDNLIEVCRLSPFPAMIAISSTMRPSGRIYIRKTV